MTPPTTLTQRRASAMDAYKQHLDVSQTRRQRRRRSWADQDMAYASLPHGKTYAQLAAAGIVARAKQILAGDEVVSRGSSISEGGE